MDELIYTNIAKNLSGEATEAERRELENWLAASPDNTAVYNDIKSFWKQSDDFLKAPRFNTAKAWDKVSAQIETKPKVTRTIAFPAWAKYTIAAAAILLAGVFVVRQMDNTITIVADANMEVELPDHSHITLRKGSELSYPKQFAANERHVELKGEAFFEVAHNTKWPFIIDAQSADVKVLGTSFNVQCNKTEANVVVRTGKVQMSSHKDAAAVILTPGEKGTLKDGKLAEENVSIDNYFYWRTGELNFSGIMLSTLIADISTLKETTIQLDASMTAEQKQQIVNISFRNQSTEEMLNDLCLITQCQWAKDNNGYIIRAK